MIPNFVPETEAEGVKNGKKVTHSLSIYFLSIIIPTEPQYSYQPFQHVVVEIELARLIPP
jgi:hypothetical protein